MHTPKQPQLFNRFQAFGATLRQSAQDVAAKAAQQVNELNAKVVETAAAVSVSSTTGSASASTTQPLPSAQRSPSQPLVVAAADDETDVTPIVSNVTGEADSNLAVPASTNSNNTTAAAVEQKDLIELLQKMNHKVKTLTAIRHQLTEQVTTLTNEKQQIRTFLHHEILNETDEEVPSPGDTSSNHEPQTMLTQLQMAWRQQEEQHQASIQMLQKEFQKLQQELLLQQQKANDNDTDDKTNEDINRTAAQQQQATWETEKQDLIQKHEQMVLQLKQQLHDAIASNETTMSSQREMEERVKMEAAQELQSFKEKVAVARKAELQKVKTETATMAKKIMETKLTEQKQIYEEQIQQLQRQQSMTVTATHPNDDAIKVLEQQLLQIKVDHTQQMEQTTLDYTQQMELLQTKFDASVQELQTLQQQQQSNETTASTQLESLAQEITELKTLLHNKDLEISRHKEESLNIISTKLQEKENQLKEQFQKETEQIRMDFQQKWKEATVANQQAAAEQIQAAIDAVTQESNQKMEELQTKFQKVRQEQENTQQEQNESQRLLVQQAVNDATSRTQMEMEQLRQTQDATVQSLQTQLETRSQELDTARQQATESQVQIEQLKSSLSTLQQQLQDVASSKESTTTNDTATASDSSSRDILQQQQQQALEEIETMKRDMDQMAQTRDEALFKVIDLQNEIQQLKLTHEVAIQTLNEDYSARTVSKDVLVEMESVTNDLRSKLDKVQATAEEEKASMRKTMESHIDTLTEQFKEKLETVQTKAAEEVKALQKSVQERDGNLKQLIEKLTSLTATSTKLRDENVAMKNKLESEMSTQKELRGQLTSLKKQLDETVANSSATASSLLKQQESLEKDKLNLENQMKKLRMELQSKSNKVEELSGKLHALSDNLNAITKGQKAMDEKLEQASKQEAKLQASEMEVNDLREQINKLKLDITKYVTTIERLQAEKDTNERNYGQRTAIVGMLETQLSELNDKYSDVSVKFEATTYDLNQKLEIIQNDAERINMLEMELAEAKVAAKRTAESLLSAQKSNDAKVNKMIESLQKELQATKQQMVRKSTAAQQLLQQREGECAELRKTNQALQNEVDKGSYSDRRIFELAAKQSSRESYQVSEIEVRDSIIDRLKEALLERDGDLASAEKHAHEVERQIEELFRIRRREDVNIDYLKSIVVQYLSLPAGSTERAGLLPVLATLLQFDDGDYRIIEDGKNKVSWWGSSVVPKLINPPVTSNSTGSSNATNGARPTGSSTRPTFTGSAEVSITSNASVPVTTKRTSLQF